MQAIKLIITGLGLLWLVGCAAFEQTPQDVQHKLSEPTKGRLYVPDAEQGY